MLLEKNIPTEKRKREALRYQPSFDLRKNIAGVIAHYSMEALREGITLDINVAHETPNYFHGKANCFVEIFSQLLKVTIASLDEGTIYIRISHDSMHLTNNCETDLTISITTHSKAECSPLPDVNLPPDSERITSRIPMANCTTLKRVRDLCAYLAGSLILRKLDRNKTLYRVNCFLQQAFPANRLQLV